MSVAKSLPKLTPAESREAIKRAVSRTSVRVVVTPTPAAAKRSTPRRVRKAS